MLVAWGGPCRSGLSRKDPILPSTIAAPAGARMVAGMLFLTSYGGDDEPVRGICELLAPGAVVSDGRWQALPCPFFGLSVFGHGGKKHGYAFCRVDALISPAAGDRILGDLSSWLPCSHGAGSPPSPRARWGAVAAGGVEESKGIWWMPWRQEAMKDVARCEKPGGAASRH